MNTRIDENDTEPKRICFSAYWSEALRTAIMLRAPSDGYRIEMHGGSDDLNHMAQAVNQGIDSHLEAVQFVEFGGQHGRRGFRVTPETLHVLVRRLMEADDETGEAHSLASGICETLNIELV